MTFSAKQFRELNDAYKAMYAPATGEEVTQEEAPVEEVGEVDEATYPSDFMNPDGTKRAVARKKKGRPNAQGPEDGKKELDEDNIEEVEESAAGMMSGQQSAQGSSQQVARVQQRLKDLGKKIKQGYETIVPPPQRSNEPSVRAGERTPETGFSHTRSLGTADAPAKLDPGTQGSTMPSNPQFKGVGARVDRPGANRGSGRDGSFGVGTSGSGMPSNPQFKGVGARSGSAAAPVKTPTPPPAPPSQPAAPAPAAPAPAARPVVSKLNTDQQAVNREYDRLRKSGDMKGAAAYGKRMAAAGASKSDFKMPKNAAKRSVASSGTSGTMKSSLGGRLGAALSGKTSDFKFKEAYDVVLEYLLSGGHAETVEEANYIMMQMDQNTIQSIVESPSFEVKGGNPSAARRQGKINKAADAGVPNAAAKAKGPILPIKGV